MQRHKHMQKYNYDVQEYQETLEKKKKKKKFRGRIFFKVKNKN